MKDVMTTLITLARQEFFEGVRNRWVVATILVLGLLALALSFLGSAPTGTIKASALQVTAVSLTSLTVYLLPLIALMLSYDSLVGEIERGTMQLLLTYPVARWQVVLGKFLGQVLILVLAVGVGYGGAGVVIWLVAGAGTGGGAYLGMMGASVLLGAVFVGIGMLVSGLVRERATAAGLAVAVWLLFVVLYDLAVLAVLVFGQGAHLGSVLFSVLLMVNPTDAFRLLSLTASAGTRLVSGLVGLEGGAIPGPGLLLASLWLWIGAPLALTLWLFQRKEI